MSRYRSYRKSSDGSLFTCGCAVVILALNALLGAWSVNFLLEVFLQKTIPLFWAFVIGCIGGEVTIPAAVTVAILKWLGVL